MEVRWSAEAVADLELISEYLERARNLETANRICRAIFDGIQSLELHPHRGRPGRRPGTRELVYPAIGYIAVYEVWEEAVYVLQIRHGAQQWLQ